MELSQYITIGAVLVALVVATIAYHRSGQPVTLQGVTEIARDAQSLAAELQQVAEVAVAAAQQLKESGKITSNTEAFAHAVDHVESWYNAFAPDINLDPKVVGNTVESAYFWLQKGLAAAGTVTVTHDADPFLQRGGETGADAIDLPPGARLA